MLFVASIGTAGSCKSARVPLSWEALHTVMPAHITKCRAGMCTLCTLLWWSFSES